jgi:hypothetical protein
VGIEGLGQPLVHRPGLAAVRGVGIVERRQLADIVPNHCQALPASSFTRTGALQVLPASPLRENITSSGSPPGGFTELST